MPGNCYTEALPSRLKKYFVILILLLTRGHFITASKSGVATLENFSSLGYPKPLVFQAKRKVEMEEKKRNIRIDQDGTCHAPVPMWQELPQITVRLEEGNTTYRFTGSFDGKHTLPEKVVKLADEQKGV